MQFPQMSGLAALLVLAGAGFGKTARQSLDSVPVGRGTKQARQLMGSGRYGRLAHTSTTSGTYSVRGLRQRLRKERRTGATTFRQQRKLLRYVRLCNRNALTNAFPVWQDEQP